MAAREEAILEALHQEAMQLLLNQLGKESSPGVKVFHDVCHFLSSVYDTPARVSAFGQELRALEAKCAQHCPQLQLLTDVALSTFPVPPASGFERCRVRLWQLGFVEGASIKGQANKLSPGRLQQQRRKMRARLTRQVQPT